MITLEHTQASRDASSHHALSIAIVSRFSSRHHTLSTDSLLARQSLTSSLSLYLSSPHLPPSPHAPRPHSPLHTCALAPVRNSSTRTRPTRRSLPAPSRSRYLGATQHDSFQQQGSSSAARVLRCSSRAPRSGPFSLLVTPFLALSVHSVLAPPTPTSSHQQPLATSGVISQQCTSPASLHGLLRLLGRRDLLFFLGFGHGPDPAS